MIIEIRRAGFVNKGAELMLHAVIQQIRARYPDAKITMAPIYGGANDTFEKMQKLSLAPKAWLWRYGFDWGYFAKFLPKRLVKMHGLVLDHEVDVVIDAAGFAYSDQWGSRNSKELADSSKKWKKNRSKLVLLPQALGPFQKNDIRKHVKKWAECADLIFAREVDSYKYLSGVVGEQSKIKLYPDFTNLVKGTLPAGYDPMQNRVAIVPNYRMIDMTSKDQSEAYLPFLIRCAQHLVRKGAKPFLLVHEGENDMDLAEKVSAAVGGIPIIKETDPLHIKGILGSCDATVGSRFHGLVSALSQGVPSLATGWSHKYQRLFEDYSFQEGLVSVSEPESELQRKLNFILDEATAKPLKQQLNDKSEHLKKLTCEMWAMVFDVIDDAADRSSQLQKQGQAPANSSPKQPADSALKYFSEQKAKSKTK